MDRQHVEHAVALQSAVGAAAAVGGEAHDVGVRRFEGVGDLQADEGGEWPDGMALRHQPRGEGQRFGARLGPHDGVPGAHARGEVELVEWDFDHTTPIRTFAVTATTPPGARSAHATR